jgi:polysaccharide biosynthesis/export protein
LRNFLARRNPVLLQVLLAVWLLASCSSYKQNIMFKVPEGKAALQQQADAAGKNYVIRKNDVLQLDVYTNNGERIIDPESVLSRDNPVAAAPTPPTYLVNTTGMVRFPLIGELSIEGLTIRQAEGVLQEAYSKYYKEPFVTLKFSNKRVTVLGAPGGQVIPLVDENVRLTEILALAKGVDNNAKANKIRVLRGDQVFVADLSTYDGYLKNNMIIEPGDIVYIEPIRRPVSEGLRDYGPAISIVTALGTLIIVIIGM